MQDLSHESNALSFLLSQKLLPVLQILGRSIQGRKQKASCMFTSLIVVIMPGCRNSIITGNEFTYRERGEVAAKLRNVLFLV